MCKYAHFELIITDNANNNISILIVLINILFPLSTELLHFYQFLSVFCNPCNR